MIRDGLGAKIVPYSGVGACVVLSMQSEPLAHALPGWPEADVSTILLGLTTNTEIELKDFVQSTCMLTVPST
jgi:hypothetical protein